MQLFSCTWGKAALVFIVDMRKAQKRKKAACLVEALKRNCAAAGLDLAFGGFGDRENQSEKSKSAGS